MRRQYELLSVARSSADYEPVAESEEATRTKNSLLVTAPKMAWRT